MEQRRYRVEWSMMTGILHMSSSVQSKEVQKPSAHAMSLDGVSDVLLYGL